MSRVGRDAVDATAITTDQEVMEAADNDAYILVQRTAIHGRRLLDAKGGDQESHRDRDGTARIGHAFDDERRQVQDFRKMRWQVVSQQLPSQPTSMWIHHVEQGDDDDQEDWNIDHCGKTEKGEGRSKGNANGKKGKGRNSDANKGGSKEHLRVSPTSSHNKSGWCFVEESILSVSNELVENESLAMSNEEYTMAMVTDDQAREDVSTTASDGDVNPMWLKVCNKRSRKTAMRTEDQETLDLNAVHNVHEDKITITTDSGAEVSAMLRDTLPNVPKSGEPENKFYRVAKRIRDARPRRQPDHVQGEGRANAVDELPTRGGDQSLGSSEQDLPKEEQGCIRRRRQLHRGPGFWAEGAHAG